MATGQDRLTFHIHITLVACSASTYSRLSFYDLHGYHAFNSAIVGRYPVKLQMLAGEDHMFFVVEVFEIIKAVRRSFRGLSELSVLFIDAQYCCVQVRYYHTVPHFCHDRFLPSGRLGIPTAIASRPISLSKSEINGSVISQATEIRLYLY